MHTPLHYRLFAVRQGSRSIPNRKFFQPAERNDPHKKMIPQSINYTNQH